MKKIIINFIIFSFLFDFILNIIIIPFKTYNPLLTKDQKIIELIKKASDEEIIYTILKNLIYVNLEIGDNIQTIPIFVEMNENQFYFRDLKMINIIPYSKDLIYLNYSYNDNYLLKNIFKLNYYNSSLSTSYKYITSCPEYLQEFFLDRDSCANETIYLKYKSNITDKEIKKQITFYISFKGFEKLDHRPGVIGLDIKNSDFIQKLKKYSEIKKYTWNIHYTNFTEENGELIIGDIPHIYDKNKYNENNLRNGKVINQKELEWKLNFDEIYMVKNKHKNEYLYLEKNEKAVFSVEDFFILGTNEFMNLIDDLYFKKYIGEEICKIKKHYRPGNYNFFFYIICYAKNKKKREELINNCPSLVFYQKEMNYKFTLDSKDLFTIIPDGERILFNIEFSYGSSQWILGKPFFKKYQLIFDSDFKMISYYVNDINDSDTNLILKKESKTIKIIIIIILIIIAFFIGILFGRILCYKFNRKIRANELEDNYSYISKKNDKDNINLRNNHFIIDYQKN